MKYFFASLCFILLAIAPAGAAILLQDDFNDNLIDGSKWSASTAAFPNAPTPTIAEANQRMEFNDRPRLNTVSTIDPDAYTGGISITGQIEFVTGTDIFKILTRSDGIGVANYGEVANGLSFVLSANGGANSPTISPRGGSLSIGSVVSGSGIDAVGGDVFDFEIIDNGTSELSFTVTRVSDSATSTTTALLTSDTTAYTPLVTFYNRENGRTSYLDDVVISSIPEPSAVGLLGLSLLGLTLRRRRSA